MAGVHWVKAEFPPSPLKCHFVTGSQCIQSLIMKVCGA